MALYGWQKDLYPLWEERGFIGLVKAPTGAGKTIAGVNAVSRYLNEHPLAKTLILSPSKAVSESWDKEIKSCKTIPDGSDIRIMTYQSAVNGMKRDNLKCDLMICDEAHRLNTPVQGQVLDMNPHAVLGLSATPEGATEILGEPFIEVKIDDANLCPFTVIFGKFIPTKSEKEEYEKMTNRMVKRAKEVTGGRMPYLAPGKDNFGYNSYDSLARRRREICYNMDSRIPHTVSLVKAHRKDRIVIYCERTEAVKRIRQALWDEGIDCSIHIQGESTLKDFEEHKSNVLALCGMLREGWNMVDTNVVIMSSVNTRIIRNVQTIGRALRIDPNNPDKHAYVYLMIAEGTSDETAIKNLRSIYKGHTSTAYITDIAQGIRQKVYHDV